ncbi:hypothetical protein F4677DRAFT_103631 [Hypoxylon crocopeplum]|nr:hypothetical protein F4677DRAFT_103631 [Hypoxylon crocopeplum]
MKESARITPVETMSTRRCVLQPFSLSDETELTVGDWACTPSGAIMQSSQCYPSSLEFNGFRFADPELLNGSRNHSHSTLPQQLQPSKLTMSTIAFSCGALGEWPGELTSLALRSTMSLSRLKLTVE